MNKHYVLAPVHTFYLTQNLLQAPAQRCKASSLNLMLSNMTEWREEWGRKIERRALISGASLNRYLDVEASPNGEVYDLVLISDSPEVLYRFLRETQGMDMEVDLWVDEQTEFWRDGCKTPVNSHAPHGAETLMCALTLPVMIRDNIGRSLTRLPRLVQFKGQNDGFGNPVKDVMEEAAAIQKVLSKR